MTEWLGQLKVAYVVLLQQLSWRLGLTKVYESTLDEIELYTMEAQ